MGKNHLLLRIDFNLLIVRIKKTNVKKEIDKEKLLYLHTRGILNLYFIQT